MFIFGSSWTQLAKPVSMRHMVYKMLLIGGSNVLDFLIWYHVMSFEKSKRIFLASEIKISKIHLTFDF